MDAMICFINQRDVSNRMKSNPLRNSLCDQREGEREREGDRGREREREGRAGRKERERRKRGKVL